MPERRLSANAQLANAAFISLILLLTLRQSEIWRPMIKQLAKHSTNTIVSEICGQPRGQPRRYRRSCGQQVPPCTSFRDARLRISSLRELPSRFETRGARARRAGDFHRHRISNLPLHGPDGAPQAGPMARQSLWAALRHPAEGENQGCLAILLSN